MPNIRKFWCRKIFLPLLQKFKSYLLFVFILIMIISMVEQTPLISWSVPLILYRRFQHLELARDFRTDFVYNNWMVMLTSCVAEVLGGAEYETLVRQRIFDVLGMNDTLLPEEITDWGQIATTYYVNASSDEMLPMAPELVRYVHTSSHCCFSHVVTIQH